MCSRRSEVVADVYLSRVIRRFGERVAIVFSAILSRAVLKFHRFFFSFSGEVLVSRAEPIFPAVGSDPDDSSEQHAPSHPEGGAAAGQTHGRRAQQSSGHAVSVVPHPQLFFVHLNVIFAVWC